MLLSLPQTSDLSIVSFGSISFTGEGGLCPKAALCEEQQTPKVACGCFLKRHFTLVVD